MRRFPRRTMLGLCAAAGACVALTACGEDNPEATTKRLDRARAEGNRVAAHAEAPVKDPEALAVYVSSAPKQRVTVVWALSCTNDDGDDQRTTGGTYVAMTPSTRQLKLPDGPRDVCHVEATTKVLRGRVKTTLLGKAP